jgi:hypothetical protein
MSLATLNSLRGIADRAVDATLNVAWSQWSCLTHTAAASTPRPVSSIVDAEALILMSLCLQEDERRLRDLLTALAKGHSKLFSVHRMQHIVAQFPDDALPLLHQFASWAKHPSWSTLGKLASERDESPPRTKDLGPLRLLNPPALQLRLRTAFGVGLKSDLLCYLLGRRDALTTVDELSDALGYTERNTRIAADDLVDAGLALRDDYSPQTTYRIRHEAIEWLVGGRTDSAVGLESPGAVRWQNWSIPFAFLANVRAASNRAEQGWSDYVIQSRARDLIDLHYPRLIRSRVLVWDAQITDGMNGLHALDRLVQNCAGAMHAAL